MQWTVTCLHQVLKVDSNTHIAILDALIASNDDNNTPLKHGQWVQEVLLSVLEEEEERTQDCAMGMDFELLDWRRRCQRMRKNLAIKIDNEEIEEYVQRPEAWCASLKKKDTLREPVVSAAAAAAAAATVGIQVFIAHKTVFETS